MSKQPPEWSIYLGNNLCGFAVLDGEEQCIAIFTTKKDADEWRKQRCKEGITVRVVLEGELSLF